MVMFLAQCASAVGFSLVFPFLPFYVGQLGSTTGLSVEFWVGMVVSSQAFTMAVTAPIWGALADRYGRKLMVQRAMFGGTVILALMAFVTSAEQLTVLRAIQGLVTGTVPAANALVAAITPRRHIGFAMGTIQMALWSGIAVGPLIGGFLSDLFGYEITFLITGGLLFLGGVLVTFGVHEDFAPETAKVPRRGGMVGEWRHVVASPSVGATFFARFFASLSRSMLSPFTPLLVALLLPQAAMVNTVTGLVVGVASGAATFSAVYLGRMGDRIGYRKVFLVCALVEASALLPQSLVTDAWQLLILQVLAGAASGGVIAALSALLARYTMPGEEGAVYGLDNAIVAGARATAPLVGSAMVAWAGLRSVFAVAGLIEYATVMFASRWLPRPAQRLSDEFMPERAAGSLETASLRLNEAPNPGRGAPETERRAG